jgi:hypothetical protein
MYVAWLHPYQVTDMRQNTATGQFLDIQKADGSVTQIEFKPAYTIEDIEVKARELCKAEDMDPDAPVMGEAQPTWKRFSRRAEALLEKRDFSAKQRDAAADSGAAMPDGSFPIKNADDLDNAIHLAGNAKNPDAARAHIKGRAKKLGLSHKIPDTWKVDTVSDLKKKGMADDESNIDDCNDEGWTESEMEDLHDNLGQEADAEDNRTLNRARRHLTDSHVLMAKGDFPGHPFRGNQWKSGDSGKAVDKSMKAHSHETASAHKAAASAHRSAAAKAAKSGHQATQKYHETMAKFHESRASKLAKKGDDTGDLNKEAVAEGGQNSSSEGAGTAVPANAAGTKQHGAEVDCKASNAAAMKDLHAKLAEYANADQKAMLERAQIHLKHNELEPDKADKAKMVKAEVMSVVNPSAVTQDAITASRTTLSTPKDVAAHHAASVAHETAHDAALADGNDQLAAYHEAMAAFHRTYLDKMDVEYQVEGDPADIVKLGRTMNREKLVVKDVLRIVAQAVEARKAAAAVANESAAIVKFQGEGKLSKGVVVAGRLAGLVLAMDEICADVAAAKSDGEELLAEKSARLIELTSDVIKDMLADIAKEANTEELGKFKQLDALRKIGARNNKSDQARIQTVHDLAGELGAECKEPGNAGNKAATEVPASSPADKMDTGAFQKMIADATEPLLAKIAKLEAEPRTPKGVLRVVTKSTDLGSEAPATEEALKPVMKGGVVNEAATAIKQTLAKGGRPFLSAS